MNSHRAKSTKSASDESGSALHREELNAADLSMEVLLVEDNPTDRMVIAVRLRHAFPKAKILVADEPLQLKEHLRRDNCDVVITDYWLGWSDGLSVLQRVRERWPRSQVIMLTGNGGEEVVAGAFRYGLYYYLKKPDGIGELVSVTASAIRRKLREDAQSLKAMIVDSMPEGVVSVDAAGNITSVNPSALKLYRYSASALTDRAFEILLPVRLRDEIRLVQTQAFEGEIVPRFPTRQLCSDGTEIGVAMTIVPIRGVGGVVSGIACIASLTTSSACEISESPSPRLAMSTSSL